MSGGVQHLVLSGSGAQRSAGTGSPVSIAAGKVTWAVSVAKLTVAVTPSSLFSFFSTRDAHDAQVIPRSPVRCRASPRLTARL
jgi:hypothetical protein